MTFIKGIQLIEIADKNESQMREILLEG